MERQSHSDHFSGSTKRAGRILGSETFGKVGMAEPDEAVDEGGLSFESFRDETALHFHGGFGRNGKGPFS